MWFLAKDPLQFARCGTLQVRPRGLDKAVHATVAPTEEQLAVAAAGGGVYWLDGQQVLIPYGVHDFVHTPREGEDWDFPDWRRKIWPNDWRISHPVPAPDATRWGLVPLSMHQLTGTKATFSLREAREVMQRLEDVQRARWRSRRTDAQELHASRQAQTPPTPAPQQEPAAPHTHTDTPETAQPLTDPELPKPPAGTAVPPSAGSRPGGPPTATTRTPTDRDEQHPAPVIPPLPQHPPLTPAAEALPGTGRRKGLRNVLRQLLRRKKN
ncbi:hypothetical protein [Streptomyces sp. NPDC049916]|uniref:hypothetical protein n=1 Tax=Streptomyces sp. NPDC049916 TaxID=3155156 RepID=UPI00342ED899